MTKINTHNRDRRGGHECTPIGVEHHAEVWTPDGREFAKKRTRRMQRRNHKKVVAESYLNYLDQLDSNNHIKDK